jgi:hypothetical protein
MSRTILFLALLFTACNNNSATSSDAKDTATTGGSKTTGYTWTKEDENMFLSDCVDGIKQRMSEDTAYIKCNCALRKLKQEFPNLDSADTMLQDSTRGAAYTANCR